MMYSTDGGVSCCKVIESTSEDSISVITDPEIRSNNNDSLIEDKNAAYNAIMANNFHFKQRDRVDIEFNNIKYVARRFLPSKCKYESKEILHGVNGIFRAGDLNVIFGPSGAGKTSLLNILAGFVETGVTGEIKINGKVRENNCANFRSISSYIFQDDHLRSWLTVDEMMISTANLKLGSKPSNEYKKQLIKDILTLLGLEHRRKTFTAKLSGGQKKKLAIALELISNRSIIFLDEPTTGLDSSSCTQCINLLKRLAQDGRTIVCTIHQPSALLFEKFDKLYTVANGHCLYQGPSKDLLPFLNSLDLFCPNYHNPADFLLEVAVGEYDIDQSKIIQAACKKYSEDIDHYKTIKNNSEMKMENISSYGVNNNTPVHLTESTECNQQENMNLLCQTNGKTDHLQIDYVLKDKTYHSVDAKTPYKDTVTEIQYKPASLLLQFMILFNRNLLCARRNYFLLICRVFAHIMIAFMFGNIYANVGNNATTCFGNYVYLYGTILFLVYTGKMSVVIAFPYEMNMLIREYFNRWYNIVPYFISLILFEIPFQLFCATSYIAISYYLTGNFYTTDRYLNFIMMCFLSTLCAQAWGYFIGATMPLKIAVFVGPVLAVLYSVFGFCLGYKDINILFRWMWHISYFRGGFHGIIDTVYGMDLDLLPCPEGEMYCHFKNPKLFLKEVSISDINFYDNLYLMIGVFFSMHILTVILLWFKLNKR